MTIKEVINQFNNLKPNSYDDEQKIKWLSDFDGWIYENVFQTHSGTYPEWKPYTNDSEILLIEEPFTELYISLLSYKVDYFNGEYDRYNNSAVIYNTQLQEYRNHYNRTHTPLQNNKIRNW